MKKATKNMLLIVAAVVAVLVVLAYVFRKQLKNLWNKIVHRHSNKPAPRPPCDFVISQMQLIGTDTALMVVDANAPVKTGDKFTITNMPQGPLYDALVGIPLPIVDVAQAPEGSSTILEVTLPADAVASMPQGTPVAPMVSFSGCGVVA